MRLRPSAPPLTAAVLLLLLAAPARGVVARQSAAGQLLPAQPPTLTVRPVASPLRIADFLDGKVPDGVTTVTGFFQREPGDGVPASRETTVHVAYDQQNLYVVFVCREKPDLIRANMAKRESIMGDDLVAVALDTFRDRRRAYLFIANPYGIQMDAITTEGQDDDYSFDALWHSEGRKTADGFVVSMAIPFKSLRFSNSDEQTWGVSFIRAIPLNNETSFWPYVTRRVSGMLQQFATLEGLSGISPGRNLQFIPYAAATGARFLETAPPRFETDRDLRVGLDAKIVVRDAFTIDAALNPDFSQVESDEPQVTVNQRFEVFFPEKRPFFIENAGMFTTPENLFFSRRIRDPQFGARVSGKAGPWALGAVAIDDRAAGEAGPGGSGDRAAIGVVRAAREIGRQSSIGMLASTREAGGGYNRVVAADTRFRAGQHWTITAQAARSDTRTPGSNDAGGTSIAASLDYSSRTFSFDSQYLDRSRDFRADLGFVTRTGIRSLENGAHYSWFPKDSPVLSFGPAVWSDVLWDRDGELQDWSINPEFNIELPAGTNVEIGLTRAFERYEGIEFRKRSEAIEFGTEWLKWLNGSATYEQGTGINYVPAAGLRPFLAATRQVELGLTIRPTPRLRVEQTYIYSGLRTRRQEAPGAQEGTPVFDLHLVRTKANYQFTRALSLRAILDYSNLRPNERLVSLDREKTMSVDLLATYMINPWTAVHVGYTNHRANLTLVGAPPYMTRTDGLDLTVGRQVFVKVGYLLRY
ncbi:MAG: DUF5916 domain-containing protein [Vicinamibacterales bacterium]